MAEVDQRQALERLIEVRRDDYSALSRLIGRNPAYIQQFIRRGTPKELSEKDRRVLAQYYGVPESELGGPIERVPTGGDRTYPIPQLAVAAAAGDGLIAGTEQTNSHVGFDQKWLRTLARGKPADLSLIKVQGDSMTPTLFDGDDILVDSGDAAAWLRDGIYVLRRDDALIVKRIARSPVSRKIAIKSDNDSYPSWPDCDVGDVDVIGRVVWIGRRVI